MEVKYLRKQLTPQEMKLRNLNILKDFNTGMKRIELVKKYSLSTAAIYKIINSLK